MNVCFVVLTGSRCAEVAAAAVTQCLAQSALVQPQYRLSPASGWGSWGGRCGGSRRTAPGGRRGFAILASLRVAELWFKSLPSVFTHRPKSFHCKLSEPRVMIYRSQTARGFRSERHYSPTQTSWSFAPRLVWAQTSLSLLYQETKKNYFRIERNI